MNIWRKRFSHIEYFVLIFIQQFSLNTFHQSREPDRKCWVIFPSNRMFVHSGIRASYLYTVFILSLYYLLLQPHFASELKDFLLRDPRLPWSLSSPSPSSSFSPRWRGATARGSGLQPAPSPSPTSSASTTSRTSPAASASARSTPTATGSPGSSLLNQI